MQTKNKQNKKEWNKERQQISVKSKSNYNRIPKKFRNSKTLTFTPCWGLHGRLMAMGSRLERLALGPRGQSYIPAGSINLPLSSSSVTKRSNFSEKWRLMHHTRAMMASTTAMVINPSQKGSSSIRWDSGLYGTLSQRVSQRGPFIVINPSSSVYESFQWKIYVQHMNQ